MGYDIIAYLDIDQEEIENIIVENKLQREIWKDMETIGRIYSNGKEYNFSIAYYWEGKHQIYSSYPTNFIRDDDRLMDEEYQRLLENKLEQPFPWCLKYINKSIRTSADAKEIADELTTWFGDEPEYIAFAEWLRETSNHCSVYELSD